MTESFIGKKVLVIGGGVSGAGAITAIEKLGGECVLFEDKDGAQIPDYKFDLIVISPSVAKCHWAYSFAEQNNIPLIGELELGAQIFDGKIIAITGTNGKTTTTELIGSIFVNANVNSFVCGNIGISFAKCAVENKGGYAIVETSSFQLESIDTYRPHIACILNISADHLERHGSMDEYIKSKLAIIKNQTIDDYLILSQDDIPIKSLEGVCPAGKVFYTSLRGKVRGAYVLGNSVYFCGEKICDVDIIRLQGAHNLSNALVAVCAAKISGIENEAIIKTLSEFTSGEHRLKFVETVGGKNYYNDSKGTNIASTIKAAESMQDDTLLILGGSDKGYEFDELFVALPKSVKCIFTLGQTAEKILGAAYRYGFYEIEQVISIEEAVNKSISCKVKNVLLSPACASFDMFKNYKERGEAFEKAVRGLEVQSGTE